MDTSSTMRLAREITGDSVRLAAERVSAAQFPLSVAARELAQLNLHYLLLPTVEGQLFAIAGQRFSSLSNDARMASADCLFSLFTIGFNDSRRWLPLLAGSTDAHGPLSTAASNSRAEAEFVTTVMFFAWHMARADPAAAKVLLDLNGEVASALRRISISQLLGAAAASVHWLEPRWPKNGHFWPALMRYSSDASSAELRATKWLGRQLLAAESLDFGLQTDANSGRSLSAGHAGRPRTGINIANVVRAEGRARKIPTGEGARQVDWDSIPLPRNIAPIS